MIRRVHIIGDRRDRFESLKDVMETFRVIMAERKRREMDPTIALLERCVEEAQAGGPDEQYTRDQLEKMLEFTQMVTAWYSQIDRLSTHSLERLFKAGAKLAKLFAVGDAAAENPAAARPPSQNVRELSFSPAQNGVDPAALAAGGGAASSALGFVAYCAWSRAAACLGNVVLQAS